MEIKTYIFSLSFSSEISMLFCSASNEGTCHYHILLCFQPPSPHVLVTQGTQHLVNFTSFVFPVITMGKENPFGFVGKTMEKELKWQNLSFKIRDFLHNKLVLFLNSDYCSIRKVLARLNSSSTLPIKNIFQTCQSYTNGVVLDRTIYTDILIEKKYLQC